MGAAERAPRAQKEANAEITVMQGAWYKRLLAVGAGVIGALGAFETLSNLPETIGKDKTFFSKLYDLLFVLCFKILILSIIFFVIFWGLLIFGVLIGASVELLTWRRVRIFTEQRSWLFDVLIWVTIISTAGFALDIGPFQWITDHIYPLEVLIRGS